jgi:hypothetical protein
LTTKDTFLKTVFDELLFARQEEKVPVTPFWYWSLKYTNNKAFRDHFKNYFIFSTQSVGTSTYYTLCKQLIPSNKDGDLKSYTTDDLKSYVTDDLKSYVRDDFLKSYTVGDLKSYTTDDLKSYMTDLTWNDTELDLKRIESNLIYRLLFPQHCYLPSMMKEISDDMCQKNFITKELRDCYKYYRSQFDGTFVQNRMNLYVLLLLGKTNGVFKSVPKEIIKLVVKWTLPRRPWLE